MTKPTNRGGRPYEITEADLPRITELVAAGNSMNRVCQILGVGHSTVARNLRRMGITLTAKKRAAVQRAAAAAATRVINPQRDKQERDFNPWQSGWARFPDSAR